MPHPEIAFYATLALTAVLYGLEYYCVNVRWTWWSALGFVWPVPLVTAVGIALVFGFDHGRLRLR